LIAVYPKLWPRIAVVSKMRLLKAVLLFCLLGVSVARHVEWVLMFHGKYFLPANSTEYAVTASAESALIESEITNEHGVDTKVHHRTGPSAHYAAQLITSNNDTFGLTGNITFGASTTPNIVFFTSKVPGISIPAGDHTFERISSCVLNVIGGTGFFQGASGMIASNVRVDVQTMVTHDWQSGIVYLP